MPLNAVKVLVPAKKHSFNLNKKELAQLLMQENIKDRFMCVVAVAGGFRTGKSFMLDFFIRYLEQTYKKHNIHRDWLGDETNKLEGFSWKYGSKRDTIGILMWPDIYLYDHPNGDKIAIILLDTQGTFDKESTMMENTTVFGLSTLISSVMIYNIQNRLDESYLQHLQLFTEYGRMALDSSNETPFQNLLFLVRDWGYPEETDYGIEGGKKMLNEYLEINDTQVPELKTVRQHIKSCFINVDCFLMPHPGPNVGTKAFDGCLKDLDVKFKENLRALVPLILAPENLVVKTINGERIHVQFLLKYLETYMLVLNSNKMPEPQTVLMATAEASYHRAIIISNKIYDAEMKDLDRGKLHYWETTALEQKSLHASKKAMDQFDQQKKLCGDDFFNKYRDILVENIQEKYNRIKELYEGKKIYSEVFSQNAVNTAHDTYVKLMRGVPETTEKHLNPKMLKEHHLSAQEKAFNELKSQLELNGSQRFDEYLNLLKDLINNSYEDIKEFNAEIKERNDRLDMMDKNSEVYKAEVEMLKKDLQDRRDFLDEMDRMRTKNEEKVEKLLEQIEDRNKRLNNMEITSKSHKEEIDGLKKKIAALENCTIL